MNSVELIGRLTRDPEVRYTSGSQMAVATFTIAIDRPPREGQEKQTDFPRITVFGRQAESCEKYLKKGRLVGISGRIQTGSYTNKDGQTVYTTDVVANKVEFIDWGNNQQQGQQQGYGQQYQAPPQQYQAPPQQYAAPPQAPAQPPQAPPQQQYQQPPAQQPQQQQMSQQQMAPAPDGFEAIDEDVPF